MSPFDVIIVGAGLAGLETGALLAQSGIRVLVLERGNEIGGRAKVVEQQGFTLNYGLHYMMGGYQSPHYRILDQIGHADAIEFAPIDPTRLWRLKGGKLHLVPTTLRHMLTTGLISGRGKLGLFGAMANLFRADPEKLWDVPLGDWLNKVAPDPSLRTFLMDSAGPVIFEAETAKISTGHFIQEMRKVLNPKGPLAIYPAGGWGALSDVFCAFIEAHGGEVRTKATVDALIFEGEQVVGVQCEGEAVRAPAVVLALPPAQLVPLFHETPLQSLHPEKIEPTMGVAVDIGFKGVQNTTIATIEMPDIQATSGFHNLFVPSLAPKDGLLFQGVRWLTPEQMADKNEVKRTEELFLQQLEAIWPDIHQKVVLRRVLVRNVIMGAHHRYTQSAPCLLPIQATEGLYLVGDATNVPGELSATAGESALLAANLLTSLRIAAPPHVL
jgi:15-cis-phytoene desaturase